MTIDDARTCLDPIAEANRARDLVEDQLKALGSERSDLASKLIASFIIRLSGIAREVEPRGDESFGRARLLELQEQYGRRLEQVLNRSVLLPPLQPYTPPPLPPITSKRMRRELGKRDLELVGHRYEASKDDDAFFDADDEDKDLRTATLVDCRFVGVNFSGYTFGPQTYLVRTRFINCKFDGIKAAGLRGSSLVFEDCSFAHATLSKSSFGYCVFEQAHGSPTTSPRVVLDNAAFSFCDIRGLVWPGIDITTASFTECSVVGSSFVDAEAEEAVFCETTLNGSDMSGAHLRKSVFRHCDLSGLQLASGKESRHTDLRQIDGALAFNAPAAQGFGSLTPSEDKRHFEHVLGEVASALHNGSTHTAMSKMST